MSPHRRDPGFLEQRLAEIIARNLLTTDAQPAIQSLRDAACEPYAAGAARINEPRISRPPRVDLNGARAIPTTPLTATAIQRAMQRTGVHVGDLIVPTYRDQHDHPPNSPTCGRLGVPLGGHPRRQPCSFRIMGHMTCQVWGP